MKNKYKIYKIAKQKQNLKVKKVQNHILAMKNLVLIILNKIQVHYKIKF